MQMKSMHTKPHYVLTKQFISTDMKHIKRNATYSREGIWIRDEVRATK